MKLFDYDSPFITWFNRITDMVFISILWVICCIPVFTAGASTAALYHTVQTTIKNNRGTAGSTFGDGLRENFKKTTLATLLFLVIFGIFVADMYMAQALLGGSGLIFKLLIAVLCTYAFWVYAYMARFQSDFKSYMKNALLLMTRHAGTSVCVFLLGFGAVILVWTLKFVILFMPALSVWIISSIVERVFRRYMSEEDKAFEDERNMDYRDDYVGKRREEKKKKLSKK